MAFIAGCFALLSLAIAPVRAMAEITNAPAPAGKSAVKVETFARGLAHPWGFQFLPDGRVVVTEREGRLRIIGQDGKLSEPVVGLPKVSVIGQGGLLDIALDPKFSESGLIYLSYAEPRGGIENGTSVARGKLVLDNGRPRLDDVQVIFRQQPAATGGLHFGSRLAFADDGTLFVTMGERYQKQYAQDLRRHFGKIVRIAADGSIPSDAPSLGSSSAEGIWSYGHRNVQGAAIHPKSRKLWIVEHGPQGGDEINIPLAGKNYGWPVIGYGIDYNGARIHEATHKEGMEQPIYYWRPSIAPSGMTFYTADLFPAWKGNLFVGALTGQHLARLVLDGERIVGEEKLLTNLGERIRDVRQGPDGALWLLTDHPEGRILRLVPGR